MLAFRFSEGVSSYMKGGLWGYVDKEGEFVIDPQYDHAFTGQDNAIYLRDGYATYIEGDLWGYVDQTGYIAIPSI